MVLAFVLVVVETGKEKEAIKVLKANKEISEVYMIYGQYDLICKVKTADLKSLDQLVNKIRKLKNIKATSTMITME
jgi:DNA-binding Lrp family transcriptional regulator